MGIMMGIMTYMGYGIIVLTNDGYVILSTIWFLDVNGLDSHE